MNSTWRFIVRRSLVASLTVGSLFILWHEPTLWLIGSFFWGVMIAASMRHGLESADREAWERKPSKTAGFAHAAILTLILAPSIVTWFSLGLLPALATAWMTLITMSATLMLADWFRGPIQDPRSTAPEGINKLRPRGTV